MCRNLKKELEHSKSLQRKTVRAYSPERADRDAVDTLRERNSILEVKWQQSKEALRMSELKHQQLHERLVDMQSQMRRTESKTQLPVETTH